MAQQHIRPRSSAANRPPAMHKGSNRSCRPRTMWPLDGDELELAQSTLAVRNTWVQRRDGSNNIQSVGSIQVLAMLREIFPSIPYELMEDVLIAAQFQMETAASMLTELSVELTANTDVSGDPEFVDWASIQDEGDAERWHEVCESRPELQQWVMVQDDWEVVDDNYINRTNARSYADVLRSTVDIESHQRTRPLPLLSSVNVAAAVSSQPKQKQLETLDHFDGEDLNTKSFGSRKRRFLRKFRR